MGHKPLSKAIKQSLIRDTPNEVRHYSGSGLEQHNELLNSFTHAEFLSYENYCKKWGTPGRKRQSMLDAINRHGVVGNVKILAEIRVDNLYTHQKILQALRHRWTSIYDYNKDIVNNDNGKLWLAMARGIQSRNRSSSVDIYEEWKDRSGTDLLAKFLKSLFEAQDGKCSITKEPMLLEIGNSIKLSDKCSPDRIDSNIGYIPGNIQLTVWWVNNMKSNMTIDELYARAEIIYKSRLRDDK